MAKIKDNIIWISPPPWHLLFPTQCGLPVPVCCVCGLPTLARFAELAHVSCGSLEHIF